MDRVCKQSVARDNNIKILLTTNSAAPLGSLYCIRPSPEEPQPWKKGSRGTWVEWGRSLIATVVIGSSVSCRDNTRISKVR